MARKKKIENADPESWTLEDELEIVKLYDKDGNEIKWREIEVDPDLRALLELKDDEELTLIEEEVGVATGELWEGEKKKTPAKNTLAELARKARGS